MAFNKAIWDQLKNTTASDLIRALSADGWEEDVRRGATPDHFLSVMPDASLPLGEGRGEGRIQRLCLVL